MSNFDESVFFFCLVFNVEINKKHFKKGFEIQHVSAFDSNVCFIPLYKSSLLKPCGCK